MLDSMDKLISPNNIPARTSSARFKAAHVRPTSPQYQAEDRWLRGKLQAQPVMEEASGTQALDTAGDLASLESVHLPEAIRRKIDDDLIHQKSTPWSAEKERILTGPYEYLFGHPGKDIRSQLIAGFNAWLHVPQASLAIITRVVGMLHTASLL